MFLLALSKLQYNNKIEKKLFQYKWGKNKKN